MEKCSNSIFIPQLTELWLFESGNGAEYILLDFRVLFDEKIFP